MRNVIPRVLAVTFLGMLTAACCKNAPPATTASAAPVAMEQVVAEQTASATAEGTAAATAKAKENSGGGSGRPETKEACAACNGKWARHGLAEQESCICRTKDGGRACLDGGECQGQCVAKESDFVVVDKGPPPRGHYKGKCSEFDTVFGCHRFVPKGAKKKGPQEAADAADQLCYD